MIDISEQIAAIQARHEKMGNSQIWDSTLADIRTAHLDRAELLRICKAQQAVVDEVSDTLHAGRMSPDGIVVPPLHWDALCDALTALRDIEQ